MLTFAAKDGAETHSFTPFLTLCLWFWNIIGLWTPQMPGITLNAPTEICILPSPPRYNKTVWNLVCVEWNYNFKTSYKSTDIAVSNNTIFSNYPLSTIIRWHCWFDPLLLPPLTEILVISLFSSYSKSVGMWAQPIPKIQNISRPVWALQYPPVSFDRLGWGKGINTSLCQSLINLQKSFYAIWAVYLSSAPTGTQKQGFF